LLTEGPGVLLLKTQSLLYKKDMKTGTILLETDVSVTKDGHLALFHDESFTRITDVESKFPKKEFYLVKDFLLKDILTLDTGASFIKNGPFEQIRYGDSITG
jgi:glycerophosphoryl diester phosphodiesterase